MKYFIRLAVACVLSGFVVTVSVAGDAAVGAEKAQVCASCHGAGGVGVNPMWPKLSGQHASYTLKQLQNFHAEKRVNAQMAPMVANLDEQAMKDLAAYYAGQKVLGAVADADAELLKAGQMLYRGGNLETGVAACTGCHGPAGKGNGPAKFPLLAGQYAAYTEAQLKAFRAGERANDMGGMMRGVAKAMTDAEMQAVAAYIQGLRSGN